MNFYSYIITEQMNAMLKTEEYGTDLDFFDFWRQKRR
jgi:hypothetical protein